MSIPLQAVAAGLKRKLAPAKLAAALAKLPQTACAAPALQDGAPCVAALQAEAVVYKSLDAFVADVDSYVAGAVQQGAQLVCFPEMFGLLPLTLSGPLRVALRRLGPLLATPEEEAATGENKQQESKPNLAAMLRPFAFLPQCYLGLMAAFAQRYGVYLSCGTVWAYGEDGKLYNRHTLLSPTGEVLGEGNKLHLVPEEAAMGLSRGDTLPVVETPLGNIALTVCMDASYFETFKIAKGLGADYALVPIGNLEPYNYYLALRGAGSRVAETGLAAVKAALVSAPGFPLGFTGRAGIYLPPGVGVDSVELAETGRGCALLALPLDAIRTARSDCFQRPNAAFNDAYFSAVTGEDVSNG